MPLPRSARKPSLSKTSPSTYEKTLPRNSRPMMNQHGNRGKVGQRFPPPAKQQMAKTGHEPSRYSSQNRESGNLFPRFCPSLLCVRLFYACLLCTCLVHVNSSQ